MQFFKKAMMATKTQFEVDRDYRHNQLMMVLGIIALFALLTWVCMP